MLCAPRSTLLDAKQCRVLVLTVLLAPIFMKTLVFELAVLAAICRMFSASAKVIGEWVVAEG